jgi:hypothetical protein
LEVDATQHYNKARKLDLHKNYKNSFQQTKFRISEILNLNLHSGFKPCGDPPRPAKVTFHGT